MKVDLDMGFKRNNYFDKQAVRILKSNLFIATTVSITALLVFSLLCTQVYNSDDDFYMLYTLAGGYGNQPTHLLHYTNGWNPFLFWPVSKLFAIHSQFNWYSLLLVVLQLSAFINLTYTLLTVLNKFIALITFTMFFLCFGCYLLQSLNVSNTSLLLAISGITSIFTIFLKSAEQAAFQPRKLVIPTFLITISGMLRIHTLAFYAFLVVIAGLIILSKRQFKLLIVTFLTLGAVLWGISLLHEQYYKTVIPNAEAQKKRRSSFFYLANHRFVNTDQDTGITKIKNSHIRSWFMHDTSFIMQSDIDYFIKKYKTNRIVNTKQSSQEIYWMFVNGRVYIVLIGLLAIVFILLKNYRSFKQWLILILVVMIIFSCLFIFVKITAWITMGLLSFLFLSAALVLRNEKMKFTPPIYFVLVLILLNMVWAIKLIAYSDLGLRRTMRQTNTLLNNIKLHPNYLFINTRNFNDNGFYIWDTPSQFPLVNLINKEQFLTNSYQHTLRRFGITDLIKSIPTHPNVYLLEDSIPFYKEYYQVKLGWQVENKKVDVFQFPQVYQLNLLPSD